MKLSGFCLSVRPSVPSFGRRTLLRRVCYCGPSRKEISIGCCTAGAQQQMRAASRRKLNTGLYYSGSVRCIKLPYVRFFTGVNVVCRIVSYRYRYRIVTSKCNCLYHSQWMLIVSPFHFTLNFLFPSVDVASAPIKHVRGVVERMVLHVPVTLGGR